MRLRLRKSTGAVLGVRDDLHFELRVEDHREAVANELLIIHEQDANHAGSPNGRVAQIRKPPPTAVPTLSVPP